MPVGAATLRGRRAHGRGDLPHAEEGAEGRRAHHQRRRRGRLRAEPQVGRRGAGLHHEGDRGSRLQAGRRRHAGARLRRRPSIFKDGKYELEGEGKSLDAARHGEISGKISFAAIPIISIEDGMSEDDWDGWKALTEASARAASSSATISSSPTPSACAQGIERGIANSILVKVNQIGSLSETLDAVSHGAARRLHRGDLAPLGRDRGRDHRRPRGRDQRGPDQDRLAVRAPTGSPSTTSSSASRRSWATVARYAGKSVIRAGA